MSRIGNRSLKIPETITVEHDLKKRFIKVTGKNGSDSLTYPEGVIVEIENNEIKTKFNAINRQNRKSYGTINALILNMLKGVNDLYFKELQIVGVGYNAQLKGNILTLRLGFSHPIHLEVPKLIQVELPSNTQIKVSGINKQEVGQFAAKIWSLYKPEPYRGKGVLYKNVPILRKQGKTSSK
ncbi:50S ribosomal protein L6 [Mycoplasma sp. SG1]|uniref:50S ribosomal protein L6 n=1 Tax=Mycoplasma sp. SG1 TaxID=2810348 RepID=UPI0020254135|nr:50S ribosomal protein L6 [Mycoplasma sp. SG1]URM52905.1 50S ribosomal protein L6 [Mycoplasma sp. SG1]